MISQLVKLFNIFDDSYVHVIFPLKNLFAGDKRIGTFN